MTAFADAVRITAHLPVFDLDHIQAAAQVTAYYKYRYGGSTASSINNSPFRGTWRYKPRGRSFTKLYDSSVCLMMIDVVFDDTTQKYNVRLIVDDIKAKLVASYAAFGCGQKAFWITCSDMQLWV